MSDTEIVKNKYLKYKNKYLNFKNMLGSGKDMLESDKDMCLICPTKKQVIEELENIIKQVPKGCIKYGFISDDLNEQFKNQYSESQQDNRDLNTTYEKYLHDIFFPDESVHMNTNSRLILTSYANFLDNSSSVLWHQDSEYRDATFYNILYYLTLENCRLDCGTEIAFRNSNSEIITIKLPIIEGLILALKDDCFSHKSPVISLIDHNKVGKRLLIRTYAQYQNSADILEKNNNISLLSAELNLQKLDDCFKNFNKEQDKSLKIDCSKFIGQYYVHYDFSENVKKIFDKYKYNENKHLYNE